MNDHKIIFTGPVGAGKTTAISALSDTEIVCTNEAATDMTQDRKKETTVAMDYGIMKLAGGERIHLYGTPGQERFNFMWEILVEGGIGCDGFCAEVTGWLPCNLTGPLVYGILYAA